MNTIKVSVPSTSANLGSGFDVVAIAHDAYRESLVLTVIDGGRGEITVESGSRKVAFQKNTAGLAASLIMEEYGISADLRISLTKSIPTGLGLGSSGASAAASVYAMNLAFDLGLSDNEMVRYAMLGETASSGTPHADNVSAALLGGITIVRSTDPMDCVSFRPEYGPNLLTVIPYVRLKNKTRSAREMIPTTVETDRAIDNSRRLSSLIHGLITGDRKSLYFGLNDAIYERSRISLYPYLDMFREKMLELGAVGVCASGAGPSILAFLDEQSDIRSMEKAASSIMGSFKLRFRMVSSGICGGARVE